MTHVEPTTIDVWSSFADLLANLIAKYAPVLDLDEPTTPTATNMISFPQGSPKSGASPDFGVDYMQAA